MALPLLIFLFEVQLFLAQVGASPVRPVVTVDWRTIFIVKTQNEMCNNLLFLSGGGF